MNEEIKNIILNSEYFIDNEYLKRYFNLIDSNLDREKMPGKTQAHHIIQKKYYKLINISVNNSQNNLVNLLYNDHILAHYLLCNCTTKELKSANIKTLLMMSGMSYNNPGLLKSIVDNEELASKSYREFFNNLCGENNPFYGKNHSDETKEKMRNNHWSKRIKNTWVKQGFENSNSHPVICIETGKIYGSVGLATKAMCGRQENSYISVVCVNKKGTAYGYHWQYYADFLNNEKIDMTINPHGEKSVVCVETEQIYSSISEAAKKTNSDRTGIGKCCNHKQDTCNNFHWVFFKEYCER